MSHLYRPYAKVEVDLRVYDSEGILREKCVKLTQGDGLHYLVTAVEAVIDMVGTQFVGEKTEDSQTTEGDTK